MHTAFSSQGSEMKKPSATENPSNLRVDGSNTREKGSIHSDIWKGTADELANSNLIAIHPTIG
ncbi:MAG TPA: hypothetical protein VKA34_10330 [Balneolales bacterium]|nr:hypothetical protein [Balneolales bacterium]